MMSTENKKNRKVTAAFAFMAVTLLVVFLVAIHASIKEKAFNEGYNQGKQEAADQDNKYDLGYKDGYTQGVAAKSELITIDGEEIEVSEYEKGYGEGYQEGEQNCYDQFREFYNEQYPDIEYYDTIISEFIYHDGYHPQEEVEEAWDAISHILRDIMGW